LGDRGLVEGSVAIIIANTGNWVPIRGGYPRTKYPKARALVALGLLKINILWLSCLQFCC